MLCGCLLAGNHHTRNLNRKSGGHIFFKLSLKALTVLNWHADHDGSIIVIIVVTVGTVFWDETELEFCKSSEELLVRTPFLMTFNQFWIYYFSTGQRLFWLELERIDFSPIFWLEQWIQSTPALQHSLLGDTSALATVFSKNQSIRRWCSKLSPGQPRALATFFEKTENVSPTR